MPNKSLYEITVENDDIIVKIHRNLINQDKITNFLDYLELEIIRKRSQLSEVAAEAIAEEINRDVWANIKDKFIVAE